MKRQAAGMDAALHEREHHEHNWNALQGACVVVAGSGIIVALAFAGMMALTGPGGWLAKASSTIIASGGDTALTSFAESQ